MGGTTKVRLAVGAAVLAGIGFIAWLSAVDAPKSPTRRAAATAHPRDPEPPPAAAAAVPVPESPAPTPVPAAAAEEPGPAGPSIEERLDEKPEEIKWEGHSVGTVLEDLSRRLRLEPVPEYESEDLRQAAYARRCELGFKTIAYRVILEVVVSQVRSPVEGKVPHWEVRQDRLFVLLRDPPPPKLETPEEAKKREENAKAFLDFLRTEKTSFVFDGQPLEAAFGYLSARHRINVMSDEAVRERVGTLAVKLTLTDASLADAFDELLRIDPDLTWEVMGSLEDAKWSIVRIRRR